MQEPIQMKRWRLLASALIAVASGAFFAGCASTAGTVAPSETSAPPIEPAATVVIASPAATVPTPPEIAAPPPESAASAPGSEAPPAPVVVDPLRPDAWVNLEDEQAQSDLWERVRRGFAMPDLDGKLVRNREQWYASRPDYVDRMTERASRYLYHIVDEVERRGMPTELALLPFIESAFNPQALSVARASGMWQFIPSTGRHYDLTQNMFRDERRDVLASTRAALDYLQKLHAMFGDWHLALAAYNWGEGSVQRALAKNRKARKPTDYASLRMPSETRYYVPKLQAVKNIVARPEAFSITLPVLENHPYFLSVPIERDIDVELAAEMAEMSIEDFKALNPQMNRPLILAAGTPRLLLPYDNANRFVRALMAHRGPMASWTAWVTEKTMRPAEAASQVGMTEEELREVNLIPPKMLVKAGSTLLVPRSGHKQADVSEHVADHAVIALTPDGPAQRRISFRAGKRGSSVAAIARKYGVPAASVAHWNDVSVKAKFRPGQRVTVYVPVRTKATRRATGRPTPTASSSKARRAGESG